MAEIQMREERLKSREHAARAKLENRRTNQMGFSSGGRPQSAAGGGRRTRTEIMANTTTTNSTNALPSVASNDAPSVTNGITNSAFHHEDPDIEEVISNHVEKKKKPAKAPPVKKVEVIGSTASDDDIEEMTSTKTATSRAEEENKAEKIEPEFEELQLTEKTPVKKKKPKTKRKDKQPEFIEAHVPVTMAEGPKPEQSLQREDTVLFPGDEYYVPPDKDSSFIDNDAEKESYPEVTPEVFTPDIRPVSRLSIQTTAGSAGIEDLDTFVFQPAPQDEQIQCRITRDRRGIDNRAYPVYYLHMEREGMKKVFLLGARKRKKSATSSYIISTDPTDVSRKNDSFVAKLRSNMMGTRFTCYDNGKAYSEPGALIDPDMLRREMVTVGYETNVLGFKGPRKMTVVIPGMDLDGERVECQPAGEKETLSAKLDARNNDNITTLQNKFPVWNEDSQSYVLNFHGRVTQASVKNFQIVHAKEPDYIVLQFGRVEDDVFTMDYKYPLCAVQAFAIALSSFDNKFACE